MIKNDNRVVLTLDAGGTNFVFSAIQGGHQIVEPVTLAAHGDNLDLSINNIYKGFSAIGHQINQTPVAISFAFPGPADYPNGIIGDLGNMPAYKGGVPLGPLLADKFQIPVFINNDGDLFAYGEAIAGFLPHINETFANLNQPFRYRNLLGITLGTGFGAGIVFNHQLYVGDNSAGAEIWSTRHAFEPDLFAEESISARAIIHTYNKLNPQPEDKNLTPKDIYQMATGTKKGHDQSAKVSFEELGRNIGEILANAVNLLDCNVVIGGGLANAYPLFAPTMMQHINSKLQSRTGQAIDRLEVLAYDLECESQKELFFNREITEINTPNSQVKVNYNKQKIIGIGRSKLGTSRAISLGAYAFALKSIDNK